MKKLLLLVVVIALLAGGGWVAYRWWTTPPDITRVGGTLVTFETVGELPEGVTPEAVTAAVRARLDPKGKEGITVRMVDARHVEIGVPHSSVEADVIAALPDLGRKRSIAVVVDGEILTAPTLQAPIGCQGEITGNFSRSEMDTLASLFRSVALPARFKPEPVSVTPREPGR
jgi:hypothetical protein